ncbi:MAG TPA: thiamine phosphate synthase [Candidatus Acidoferrales bacterium]|nr:thiamine phosphate synthase [Candidatus Acidoferrales bacterium]
MPAARKSILCYVTDRRGLQAPRASSGSSPGGHNSAPPRSLQDSIRRAAAAGINWIQIREKDLDARSLLELARFAVAETHASVTRVLVNDRLDIALAAGAAGIHLGEESLPLEAIAEWRRSGGRKDFVIGVSCHSLTSARAAERGGADYVFFGPVFATPSKAAFGDPQGIERLREVCAAVEIPVLAIGGVNLGNARACLAAGAAGVAAIRLFQDAEDVAEVVAVLRGAKQ